MVCATARDGKRDARRSTAFATHQYHHRRPSLSRRKLKALAGNSEGFFCLHFEKQVLLRLTRDRPVKDGDHIVFAKNEIPPGGEDGSV
jgi:hypothetical protein